MTHLGRVPCFEDTSSCHWREKRRVADATHLRHLALDPLSLVHLGHIHSSQLHICPHTFASTIHKSGAGGKRKEPQPAAAPSRHLDAAASRTQARDPFRKNIQEKEIYSRRDGVMVCMIIESQSGKRLLGWHFCMIELLPHNHGTTHGVRAFTWRLIEIYFGVEAISCIHWLFSILLSSTFLRIRLWLEMS